MIAYKVPPSRSEDEVAPSLSLKMISYAMFHFKNKLKAHNWSFLTTFSLVVQSCFSSSHSLVDQLLFYWVSGVVVGWLATFFESTKCSLFVMKFSLCIWFAGTHTRRLNFTPKQHARLRLGQFDCYDRKPKIKNIKKFKFSLVPREWWVRFEQCSVNYLPSSPYFAAHNCCKMQTDRQTDRQTNRQADRQTLFPVVDMGLGVSRLTQTDRAANLQSRYDIKIGVSRKTIK